MRGMSLLIAALAALAASYSIGRRNGHAQMAGLAGRHALYYLDPMHPTYRSNRPGVAPDCGMQLEPVFADDTRGAAASSAPAQLPAGAVLVDHATQQLLGIRLASAERNGASHNLRVVGRVVPEDIRVYRINSGVDGFIRETYNDSVGLLVKKNQKLATYFAPDFLPAASGFLAAAERLPGAVGNDGARTVPFPGALAKQGVSSIQGYTDRLRNLGMSDVQIQQMADGRQLPASIDVVAPADGFILARNITPGQHFERNMEFYRVADLRSVWVVAEIDEKEVPYLRSGDRAQIVLRNEGRQLQARIADSLPQSEVGGGTVKLRLEVENPAFLLRPEMLVDVSLPVRLPPAVTVPLDALVDSGTRARVYIERVDGVFEPREVETGWRFGDRVEIRHGLQAGENVVVGATFLVDSESRLKTPRLGQAPARTGQQSGLPEHTASARVVRDPSCGTPVNPAEAAASGNTLANRGETYYFCSSKCKHAFQKSSVPPVNQGSGS